MSARVAAQSAAHTVLTDAALADRLASIASDPRSWSASDRASLLGEAARRLRGGRGFIDRALADAEATRAVRMLWDLSDEVTKKVNSRRGWTPSAQRSLERDVRRHLTTILGRRPNQTEVEAVSADDGLVCLDARIAVLRSEAGTS